MAINIQPGKCPIRVDDINQYLQRSTDSFGVFFDLDRIYELEYILYEKIVDLTHTMWKISGKKFDVSHKDECVQCLIDMGVPGQLFGYNNALNKEVIESIQNGPTYSESAKYFAKAYGMYSSIKNRYSTMRSYAQLTPTDRVSRTGHRLVVAHPKWKTLNTSRQATSEPNVQAVARDFKDIITEPEGYNLVRCDSNQIEPRISWSYFWRDELIMNLITCYNDAYMGIMEYCLLSPQEEAALRQDFSHYQKKEIDASLKEKRQKIKRFTLAASYGSANLDSMDPELGGAYTRKIINHPKRKEMEARVKEQVVRGDSVFYGAFGTPVMPEATGRYQPGTTAWQGHVVRCGINNPIQTTASELMLFSVNEARKILANTEDSHIAFYKHDEGCFYVSDKDKANGVLEQLAEITAYNVTGWIPIPCETEYGTLHSDIPTAL